MKANLFAEKKTTSTTQYDIKLELDVECQRTIETILTREYPESFILGEEGDTGDEGASHRWVIDPIDGTVNFTYGIPHACVSIALQEKGSEAGTEAYRDGYQTTVAVIYDPFCEELWTATLGEPAALNGIPIQVSNRDRLEEALVSVGFSKNEQTLDQMLPVVNALAYEVRKIRTMGAAALAMVYVASGRFDGYVENNIRLWDIAAGGLIVESAGGVFWRRATEDPHTFQILASNRALHEKLASRCFNPDKMWGQE